MEIHLMHFKIQFSVYLFCRSEQQNSHYHFSIMLLLSTFSSRTSVCPMKALSFEIQKINMHLM